MKVPVISSFIFLLCSAVTQAQVITTFAGTYNDYGFSGDGGPAGAAIFNGVGGVALDAKGNLYIADYYNQRIRKVGADGTIITVAGNGTRGYSGSGEMATDAELNYPDDVAIGLAGNIYINNKYDNYIFRVDSTGIITTVAGNGSYGYSGDGGPATLAQLNDPLNIAADGAGNIYVSDVGNNVIRKILPNGFITTIAGNGISGHSGDGGPATNANISPADGLVCDRHGNLFFSEGVYVRKVDTNGVIVTIAGKGDGYPITFSGDGGPATDAYLDGVAGLAIDKNDNIYVCDQNNEVVRKIDARGVINTVAGIPLAGGYYGDGGMATNAWLYYPLSVTVDSVGDFYISDGENNVIRKVTIGGVAGVQAVNLSGGETIFPNPFSDMIYVTGLPASATYCISNMVGQEVQAGLLQPGKNSISLSVPPGVYLMEITGGDGSRMVTKVVRE